MKKYIFSFLFCFGITVSVVAQDLNSYQYVRVPSKFEFLKEENQYQLNALTAFLFEKYGFTPVYNKEIPMGVAPCDVLKADVHEDSNLFKTKIYITLADCENKILFTSETGSSREKDFKDSYHEALREAFVSFENLGYRPKLDKRKVEDMKSADKDLPKEIIVDLVVTSEEMEEVDTERSSNMVGNYDQTGKTTSEAAKNQKFINGSVIYVLGSTPVGYDLFREGVQERFASLMKSGGGDNYLYSSKNISGNAFFDGQGNLVVEYLDPNSQQLITVIYKLQSQ